MKLLHTSDWHLGRTLYGRKERYEEHALFLEWLLQTIADNAVNVLLIAGDVFDTASPGSNSQKMYYDFLLKVRNSGCNSVIVVGGNHDSPSLLDAPKEILSALDVKIVGKACEDVSDEVFAVYNNDKTAAAIICAVPFLRERDVSRFTEGETYGDHSRRILRCIKKHYETAAVIALEKRASLMRHFCASGYPAGENYIPIIATGHLSVAGGRRANEDGVRDTYIGSIECVGSDVFPPAFDYVALGHYHIPSRPCDSVCYSGSPIPMGFGEAAQQKNVILVEFENADRKITEIPVPVFQKLKSVTGDKSIITSQLSALKEADESVWTEIIYDGSEIFADFATWVDDQVAGTKIEVLKKQNRQYMDKVLTREDSVKPLEELNAHDVFDKLLADKDYPDEQKKLLRDLYGSILDEINETDSEEQL